MSRTIRFPAEVARYEKSDVNCETEIWEPCLVEMSVDPSGRHSSVYDVDVRTIEKKALDPQDELSEVRERVGRIARRLEDVASDLRLVAEGLSPSESARVLDNIEKRLGL